MPHTPHCEGVTPLTARLEPWMQELLDDAEQCAALIEEYGSPVNVHNTQPLARNINELTTVAAEHDIRFAVYLARKANKTISIVQAARHAGAGIDVASRRELAQTLEAGVPGERIVFSAAMKTPAALDLAITHDVTISVDNRDEAALVLDRAKQAGTPARVALRLAIIHPDIAPTRFGLPSTQWLDWAAPLTSESAVNVVGLHIHLNGYSATERAIALRHGCTVIDALREQGHTPDFIDMGGGIPMSYLDDADQWQHFWHTLDATQPGTSQVTWRGDQLGLVDPAAQRPSPSVYPYYQSVVRGQWLNQVLSAPGVLAGAGQESAPQNGEHPTTTQPTIAGSMRERGIELRCEPGRSLLDGCGMTLAQVTFRKHTSDGIPLVGLMMNRTQVRSTSADFLVDPVLVRPAAAGAPEKIESGFFVGAYCIEEELILRRRMVFPQGVACGDIVAFPNTGGYLMHILESASHQIPLAANVVAHGSQWVRDEVDAVMVAGGEPLS